MILQFEYAHTLRSFEALLIYLVPLVAKPMVATISLGQSYILGIDELESPFCSWSSEGRMQQFSSLVLSSLGLQMGIIA